MVGQRRPRQSELFQIQIAVVRVAAMVALFLVLVLNNSTMVKAAGQADRCGVHLADIDRVITAVPELLDPVRLLGRQPSLVAVNAVRMHVLARDDAIANRPSSAK